MEYLILKWIHILSATILLGTGLGSAYYLFMANRKRDVANIYFAAYHVVIADFLFITPAVIVQLASGLLLLTLTGYSLSDWWVTWGLALYFFAGLCWLPAVWVQIRMRDMAKAALDDGAPLPDTYWRLDRCWIVAGSLAFPAVVVVFYLMVVKP
ncbi:MAG: DUF2269 family protein [Xanthobacteraceae bacterium]